MEEQHFHRHHPGMSLTLQFVSLDEHVQADCPVRTETPDVPEFASILTGNDLAKAVAMMIRASTSQRFDGEYVRHAGRVYSAHAASPIAQGRCSVFAFPTEGDRDAFCLLSKALPARFVRAVAQTD
jgi:hypothetical protein